jgi:hypothetical protein
VIVAVLLSASLATACGKPDIVLQTMPGDAVVVPCANLMSRLDAGTAVSVETSDEEIRGRFTAVRGDRVFVDVGKHSVTIAARDIQRVIRLGSLRSWRYAARGTLTGIGVGILAGLKAQSNRVAWGAVNGAEVAAWGAAFGALEGSGTRDGVLFCGSL